MNKIDARGLDCPAPVLLAKDALENKGESHIEIIVDNAAAKENVCLFLESRQFLVSVSQKENDYYITGTGESRKKEDASPETASAEKPESDLKKILVMAATDRIGFGDDELGLKLMINFIKTLKEMGPELWRLLLVNNGVKLAVEGSEALPVLKELEADGIRILVCGTCLDHYHLLEKKKVGKTTNMLDIVTAMHLADKVITL